MKLVTISNVQLIPTPSKMEYAIYNLCDNSTEDSDKLTDSISTKLIKEEEHNDDKEIEHVNHDNINHIVGLVGKNKMIM